MNLATIESILLGLLVLDAIALVVLVLLQQGKGADVGAAFGSGSSNTVFGSLGAASFFTKATAWLAIGFFVITFGLAYVAKQKSGTAGTLGIPVASEQAPAADTPDAEEQDVPALEVPELDVPDAGDVPELDMPEPVEEFPEN